MRPLALLALWLLSLTPGLAQPGPDPKIEPPLMIATCAEAVDHLLGELDPESVSILKQMPEADLILLHHSFGMYVRNSLGLWQGNVALAEDCDRVAPDDVPEEWRLHPDTVSMILIRLLWAKVRAE